MNKPILEMIDDLIYEIHPALAALGGIAKLPFTHPGQALKVGGLTAGAYGMQHVFSNNAAAATNAAHQAAISSGVKKPAIQQTTNLTKSPFGKIPNTTDQVSHMPNKTAMSSIQPKSMLAGNPWKVDAAGHVAGTKLSPEGYKQHLLSRPGATIDSVNEKIRVASHGSIK